MMDMDDVMDVEMPDLPEFDMLEVDDGAPHEESSSKVLEEWRKPETPLDDVVDEIMEIDVQMGEDLLDEKFFYEDPCLSPTSALDDLVFSDTALDDKELTLFSYPEDNESAPAALAPSVHSNIPTPPPPMSSFNTTPNPKPASAPSNNTSSWDVSPAPVPSKSAAVVPRVNVPHVALPPHVGSKPPHPYPHHYYHHPHSAPARPPSAPAEAAKPTGKADSTSATTTPAPKSRSRPKQKKAPPKLNYIPAPPHMQPQPIAAAAAAAGAKRAAAAHAARIAAAAAASGNKKPATPGGKKAGNAPASRAPPKKSASASKKAAPKTPTKKAGTKTAAAPSPPPSPPAFMKDEKYQATLQKLTESMIRSQESRKCFQMKTDKTEKYARSMSVSKVLSSIEQSTRQIQTYLQGPAYGGGAISSPSSTPHHNHPPSQPPAQPRNK